MTLNEMIRKWNIVIVEQNGEKMLKAIGKFTPKQAEMVKHAHGSAASVVATYDPRLGAVVVASHSPDYRDGDVVADVDWPF